MTRATKLAAAVACALGIASAACGGADEPANEAAKNTKLTQPELIAKVKPSVARIQGKQGGGSGVVIDAEQGLVLTNAHVAVGLEGTKVRIGDDPATETAAQLHAAAPCDDLAVLRLVIKPQHLTEAELGDSSKLKQGEHVTVLGYPGTFEEQSLDEGTGQAQQLVSTDGTVSAVDIAATPDPALPRFASTIQHQAPVNPGNSGGPLVNDRGQVIGINTLRNPETQGQFYAISGNRMKQLLPTLLEGESLANPGWDLIPLAEVDLEFVFANDPDYGDQGGARLGRQVGNILEEGGVDGLYVTRVETGSSADRAKIFYGDLITRIEGEPVTKLQDVCDLILAKSPGEKVSVSGYVINSGDEVDEILDDWTVDLKIR